MPDVLRVAEGVPGTSQSDEGNVLDCLSEQTRDCLEMSLASIGLMNTEGSLTLHITIQKAMNTRPASRSRINTTKRSLDTIHHD